MAHTVNTQVLVDGSKHTIIKVTIKGDGSSGELSNYVIYDASAYTAGSTKPKLDRIQYCLNGFSGELFWDATLNISLISIDQDISEDMDFTDTGGLIDNAGAGRTGDILLTTTGLASSSKDGYIIFYINQREVPVIK